MVTSLDNDTLCDDKQLDNDTLCDDKQLEENNNNNNHDSSGVEGEGFVVYVRKDAGTATIAPVHKNQKTGASPRNESREDRLPQTIKSAARQARARLRNHAVANKLGACFTLTYRNLTEDPAGDLSKFIRDVRRFYPPPMHWISVSEGGGESEHRIHHHVLLPLCSNLHKVASQWPHGDIHVGINPTDSSIRKVANYVAKKFSRETGRGPRFRSSRGGRPTRSVVHAESLEEATEMALAFIPNEIDVYTSNAPGIEGRITLYWETNVSVLDQ